MCHLGYVTYAAKLRINCSWEINIGAVVINLTSILEDYICTMILRKDSLGLGDVLLLISCRAVIQKKSMLGGNFSDFNGGIEGPKLCNKFRI